MIQANHHHHHDDDRPTPNTNVNEPTKTTSNYEPQQQQQQQTWTKSEIDGHSTISTISSSVVIAMIMWYHHASYHTHYHSSIPTLKPL
ncbi:hypothetical protein DERF_010943 [Dermatophagoides farinae]|uniref:Uncharacterized protein n=1 Tax=Dermatophagoides farinae TaxID=6954 RepID=A0A922L2M8_DERFA|nr:hypothetical protein DERF_010943 [Dermatophagoides farinae]